jgi:hypothetical protein
MHGVAAGFAVTVMVADGIAALVGGAFWWRSYTGGAFWPILRAAQVAAAAQALAAGILFVSGFRPADGLYWLYAVLPIAVGVVAEQVRALSAQSVLDAAGFESAQEVGRLDQAGQRAVVRAILRREMGIMALSAVVTVFLALRALGTA